MWLQKMLLLIHDTHRYMYMHVHACSKSMMCMYEQDRENIIMACLLAMILTHMG